MLEYIEQAQTGDELTRGLKWRLALDAMLLRAPDRGGRRLGTSGAGEIDCRFACWRDGDYDKLVHWWQVASAAARRRRERRTHRLRNTSEEGRVAHALQLIRDGELSRAQAMLLSLGVHESTEAVLGQLRERFPARVHPFPRAPPAGIADDRIEVSMAGRYAKGRRRQNGGLSGTRNEYLRVRTHKFTHPRASMVMEHEDAFANRYLGGALPDWWYLAQVCASLIAREAPKLGRRRRRPPRDLRRQRLHDGGAALQDPLARRTPSTSCSSSSPASTRRRDRPRRTRSLRATGRCSSWSTVRTATRRCGATWRAAPRPGARRRRRRVYFRDHGRRRGSTSAPSSASSRRRARKAGCWRGRCKGQALRFARDPG